MGQELFTSAGDWWIPTINSEKPSRAGCSLIGLASGAISEPTSEAKSSGGHERPAPGESRAKTLRG